MRLVASGAFGTSRFAVFHDWLSFNALAEMTNIGNKEHELVDVNGLGYRWRRAISDVRVKSAFLTDAHRDAIASPLGIERAAVRAMQLRYWDSVIRDDEHDLEVHTDECPEEEERAVAIAIYGRGSEFWREDFGGEIVLHADDEKLNYYRRDDHVMISPIYNACVAFTVNKDSFHSVFPPDKGWRRHAIVGWLNGPLKYTPGHVVPPAPSANTVISKPIKKAKNLLK